jgi:hypothetical protein
MSYQADLSGISLVKAALFRSATWDQSVPQEIIRNSDVCLIQRARVHPEPENSAHRPVSAVCGSDACG